MSAFLFYFDMGDDDGGHNPDLDGLEFDNLEAAYIDAYHSAIDMWAEARHRGRDLSNECFVIKGATGNVLLELPFSEVLGNGKTYSTRVAPKNQAG